MKHCPLVDKARHGLKKKKVNVDQTKTMKKNLLWDFKSDKTVKAKMYLLYKTTYRVFSGDGF